VLPNHCASATQYSNIDSQALKDRLKLASLAFEPVNPFPKGLKFTLHVRVHNAPLSASFKKPPRQRVKVTRVRLAGLAVACSDAISGARFP